MINNENNLRFQQILDAILAAQKAEIDVDFARMEAQMRLELQDNKSVSKKRSRK